MTINTTPGDPNAVSYATLAQANAYFLERGIAAWAALADGAKESALVRGCDYLTQTYHGRWAGNRTSITQGLDWPRSLVPISDFGALAYYPQEAIPVELVRANCEAAIRASTGELIEDLDAQVASEKVGPIETSYFQGGSRSKKYPVIEKMLAPLLASSGVRMVRS